MENERKLIAEEMGKKPYAGKMASVDKEPKLMENSGKTPAAKKIDGTPTVKVVPTVNGPSRE